MTTQCRHCGHQEHLHTTAGHCRATTVSGPPSDKGRPISDGYAHTGRLVVECPCERFGGRNGAAG